MERDRRIATGASMIGRAGQYISNTASFSPIIIADTGNWVASSGPPSCSTWKCGTATTRGTWPSRTR